MDLTTTGVSRLSMQRPIAHHVVLHVAFRHQPTRSGRDGPEDRGNTSSPSAATCTWGGNLLTTLRQSSVKIFVKHASGEHPIESTGVLRLEISEEDEAMRSLSAAALTCAAIVGLAGTAVAAKDQECLKMGKTLNLLQEE